jgi:hypothetical protein
MISAIKPIDDSIYALSLDEQKYCRQESYNPDGAHTANRMPLTPSTVRLCAPRHLPNSKCRPSLKKKRSDVAEQQSESVWVLGPIDRLQIGNR